MLNKVQQKNISEDSVNILINFFQKGKYKEAEILAINISKSFPNNPICWKILGIIYLTSGRYSKALFANKRAIKLLPNTPDTHNNLAITFYNLGRYEEAIKSSKNALKIDTNFVQAYGNLADSLKAIKNYEDSILYLKKSIKLNPNKVETHASLADALHKLGKLDDALITYENAIKLNSNFYPAYLNMAEILNYFGRFTDSINLYNKVIKIKPNLAITYYNLANIQKKLNKINDAISNFQKALEINPNLADAHYNLANSFSIIGKFNKAEFSYEKAIKINPENPKFQSNKLLNLNYNPNLSPEYVFNQHKMFEKQFSYLFKKKYVKNNTFKGKNRRLRIGYVSPDFRRHSVAYFFKALLKNHNSNLIETFCYYNNDIIDDTTKLLRTFCENWRSIFKINDKEVIKIIKEDNIDILIDLCGHMAGNRLLVFASKAAPIQITYLGYPNTTGLSAMDYRITDKHADPEDNSNSFYSEKLIKLDKSFLCYTVNDACNKNNSIPLNNNNFITFGSFNNFKKINLNVVKVWSSILLSIPNSHLILKSSNSLSDSNFLLNRFMDEGVTKENIKIYRKKNDIDDHMKLYNSIDIALDTFPYNGTTTTFEALWMGVPVITLSGNSHMCRVSSSILQNLKLNNFIAYNINDYQKIAIKMSTNKEYLVKLKKSLREQLKVSNLCDGKSFTEEIEEKLFQISNKNK